MHRYTLRKKLGSGAFGDVRLADDNETGEKVAVKTFKAKYSSVEQLLREPEVKALRSLTHPNIIQCKEYLYEETQHRAHLIFELMNMGSLERLCRKSPHSFSESEIRSIFHQVLVGVQYMHSKNFIHRDIKPENILLQRADPEPIVKLADLGLAKHIGSLNDRPKTTYVATRWYRSPEILLRIRSYGKPSDIWAIGVVMAEVVAKGIPLFPGTDEDDQLRRVVALRGHPRAVNWEQGTRALKSKHNLPVVDATALRAHMPSASASVVQLIEDMLQMDPDARPTATDALQSSMFMPSPSLQVEYASSLDSYEYGNAYHGEDGYNQAHYEKGCQAGEKAKQLKRDETAVYEEHGDTPQGVQQQTERNYAQEKPADLTRQFYIPPAAQERSITYTNPQRLRSPAGNFNLAPRN